MFLDYDYRKEECEQQWRDRKVKWSPDLHLQSEIARFYEGKNIFVTGATGFLGKLVVEKLLRACPGISAIYILVRSKKGQDEMARVDKLYEDEVFSVLRELHPNFRQKIHVITGDVTFPDAGISLQDQQIIIEQVNVMFHIAATVSFDERLSIAVNTNIRAVRDLLKLAKRCRNLLCFQHVSTAFANCNRDDIDEVIYEPSIDSEDLFRIVSAVPASTLDKLTPKIIQGWPNTYAFTKQVAEHAVRKYSEGLPVCIFRPAIVISTYKEPLRSWSDNLYGITGIAVASGVGVFKTIRMCADTPTEVVPADYVINGMIAAAHRTAIDKISKEIPIYNYVSSTENRVTNHEFLHYNKLYGTNFSSAHKYFLYSNSRALQYVRGLLLHFFVALVMDLLLRVGGRKATTVKLHRKIAKFEAVIAFFTYNEWNFGTSNMQSLCKSLSKVDAKLFPCDIKEVCWDKFNRTHWLGLREYVLKEDPKTVNRRYMGLVVVHSVMKTVFYGMLLGVVYSICKTLYYKHF